MALDRPPPLIPHRRLALVPVLPGIPVVPDRVAVSDRLVGDLVVGLDRQLRLFEFLFR